MAYPAVRRVLVTGAAGVIGRALVPALEAARFEIRGFDRASRASDELLDAPELGAALSGVCGVVHLAACSRVETAERRPDVAARDNVRATVALLAASFARPSPPWVVFASSREVHGNAARLPVDEDSPVAPRNVYGRTKRDAEALVEAARARGLRTSIVRLTNVFGAPWDCGERLVPAFVAAAREGRPLGVRGAARSVDLLHVEDAVSGLVRAAQRLDDGAQGLGTLLLASGIETTLGALAELVVRLARSSSPIRHEPAPAHEVERFVGKASRAFERLGWRANVSLEEGVSRLLAAHP